MNAASELLLHSAHLLFVLASKDGRDDESNDFHDALTEVVEKALRGKGSSEQVADNLFALVSKYLSRAYTAGLKSGGVNSPTTNDDAALTALIKAQAQPADGFADFLVEARDSDDDLATVLPRMDLWRNTVAAAYDAGENSAKADEMVEFTGDDGEESCRTCMALKGKQHRRSWFVSRGLVPGQPGNKYFECGGWRCQHYLSPVGKSDTAKGEYGLRFDTRFV